MRRINWFLVFLVFFISPPLAVAGLNSRLPQTRREKERGERRAEVRLERAQQYLLEGNYQKAYDYLAGTSSRNTEAAYLLGVSQLKLGYYAGARDTFQKTLADNSTSALGPDITLGIADSYFMEEKYSKATALYEEILEKFPESPILALALSRLAESFRKTGQWSEAEKYLKRLGNEYPLSFEADSARRLASPAGTAYFTVQIGSFASRENAERLRASLEEKDFPAYVEESRETGDTLYRVRVGKLSSLAEARRLRDRLQRSGFPTRIFP